MRCSLIALACLGWLPLLGQDGIVPIGPLCSNAGQQQLSAQPEGWFWGGDASPEGIFDPAVGGADSPYFVTYTHFEEGEPVTFILEIVVFDAPEPTIAPAGPFCANDGSQQLEAFPEGGAWDGDFGSVDAQGLFNPVFGPDFSPYGIQYTVTDSNGCSATDTLSIIVGAIPEVSTETVPPLCSNDAPVQLTGLPEGGIWSGAAEPDGTFDPAMGAGSQFSLYTYADSLGCSNSAGLAVLVLEAPEADIAPAGPFCDTDGAQQLTAMPEGGTWDGDFGSVDQQGVFNPFFGPDFSPYAVWYTVTNANGCSAADTLAIIVSASPEVSTDAPSELCADGEAVQLTGLPMGGSWSGEVGADGLFDPGMGSGFYFGLYTYTDSLGCSNSASVAIQVREVQQPEILSFGPYCADDGPTLLWSTPFFGTYGGAADPFGYVDPGTLGEGEHLVTYTYTCTDCCPATDSVLVVVAPLPQPEVISDVICLEADTAILEAEPAGGTWSGVAEIDGVVLPASLGAGYHTVGYSYTDALGCTGTVMDSIAVRPSPDFEVQGPLAFCAGSPADTLRVLPDGGLWSGDVDANGLFVPGEVPGEFAAIYTYQDSLTCAGTLVLALRVDPLPDVEIQAAGPFCENDSTTMLTAEPPGGAWSGAAIDGLFDPASSGSGTVLVYYQFTDSLGCIGNDSLGVVVEALPEITFTELGPFCTGSGPQQLAAEPGPGTWGGATDEDGLFDADTLPGSYTVTYSHADGACIAEAEATVVVELCESVAELSDGIALWLYPNPARDAFFVEALARNHASLLRVHDAQGRMVLEAQLDGAASHRIDISGLAPGMHTITLFTNGSRGTARLIILP